VATALAPPPSSDTPFEQIDRQLWRTFVQEMQSNLVRVSDLASAVEDGTADAPSLQELGRILHSIKGAAMVVPVDAVARATHLLESLLEQVRTVAPPWSAACFEQYADWMADLCNPQSNPREALARGLELECDITAALAKFAG
jgi:chemotaxis protein histidine kinase CheA